MAGYVTKLKRDIDRWSAAGLIDAATAATLIKDAERNSGGRISFGAVLAMMAATLFGAAILLIIAANWEAIPRMVRVVALFVVIAAGYVGGAILKTRGRGGAGEACWMVAAIGFGATIALIGQMYHMSGDEKQAILVWGAGTLLAAAALRSAPLTVAAALLGATWMTMHGFHGFDARDLPLTYPLLALAIWAVSLWTGSTTARHVLLLSLYLFVVFLYWRDDALTMPILLFFASAGLFALGHYRQAEAERFVGLGGGLFVQALVGFLTGLGVLQIVLMNAPEFLVVSIAAMVGIVVALLVAGRTNAILRWLAYAAFTFQICFIYVVMLGSMLGTAGFFLVVGLVLAGLAVAIGRLERRFFSPPPSGEATA